MSRVGGTPIGFGFVVAIWVLGQVLGQLAEPGPVRDADIEVEQLPRSAQSGGSGGRVAQLAVDRARRGAAAVGTAWHVGDNAWLSNRHVIEHCAAHELNTRIPGEVERLWVHPDADLAAMRSQSAEAAVGLARNAPRNGNRAYAIGYPQGEPGVAELTLHGEGRMQLTGALSSERPFRYKVWGIRRLPDHVRSAEGLGGISGGAVIDAAGEAVGAVFASNNRRGTLLTIPHAEVRAAARAVATDFKNADSARSTGDPRRHAERLLESDRVARVLCRY